MKGSQQHIDEQRRCRALLGYLVSIAIATAACLLFVVLASDDARVARSFAGHHTTILHNGSQP